MQTKLFKIPLILITLVLFGLLLPNFPLNLTANQIQAEQETLPGGAALESEIESAVKLSQNKIAPVIQNGKVVMFEASHNQDPYNDCSYWIEDLEAAGYTILVNTEPLSSQAIDIADVLIVSVLRHNYSISSPYTASEAQIIKQYVSKGGGLMVLADHDGYSWYAQEISLAFGITLNGEMILKQPIFSSANFDAGHPIMAGINSIGYNWYTTITPGTTSPLIWEDGGDAVAVTFFEGSGKGAVFGDSNWPLSIFSNYYWVDNSLLALQTVDWLASQAVNQPPTISNLGQFKSDGIVSIAEGNTTTESTVVFKATFNDPENDQVKFQVEIKEYGQEFNEQDLLESDFISSGTTASLTRFGLINGSYKWRARAVDDKGNKSGWQEFGEPGNIDFEVKLVPLYTQIISPYPSEAETILWHNKPYAYADPEKGIRYDCGYYIRQCGCALTSGVMVLRYYNVTNVNSEDVNPRTANEWLKNNKGYFAGNVNWLKVAEYSNYKVKYDTAKSGNYVNNYPLLDEYLNKNQPVIAKEINPGHFIVIDNKLTTAYGVKDPSWYNTKKLDESTTDWTSKIRDYNNNFYGLRLFYPGDGIAMSAISLTLASPAEILITDPLGRKLGKDPISDLEYNEIPEGSYFAESIDDPTGESPPSNEESKVLYIGNPVDGQYNVEIIGTGSGSYSMNLLAYAQNGESEEVILEGNTITNNIQEFELNYSNQTIEQTEVYRIVDIDIKPGSYPNSINLKSKGVTPVTVLTDEFFNAKDIVIDSIVFAGAKPERGNLENVDSDGDLDLILHFKTQSLQLSPTDTEAVLTGQLNNSSLIKGIDSVRIVSK